jgi:hypothetical protein
MSKTKKSKRDLRKKRELNRRLLNYSLAAGTTLALATPASAAIRYSGVKNQVIDNSAFELDMQDVIDGAPDGNPEFVFFNNNASTAYTSTRTTTGGKRFSGTFSGKAFFDFMFLQNSGDAFMANGTTKYSPAAFLNKGNEVGPGVTNFLCAAAGSLNKYYKTNFQGVNTANPLETYDTSYKVEYGNFGGKRGYMGVRFNISGKAHYGWIQFDGTLSRGTSATIVDWAYEDQPGKTIAAGDTGLAPIPTLNQ